VMVMDVRDDGGGIKLEEEVVEMTRDGW